MIDPPGGGIAYELQLVAAFAADRPASADRQPGEPGAAGAVDTAPEGVSEFFPDEPALTLTARAVSPRASQGWGRGQGRPGPVRESAGRGADGGVGGPA